MSGAASAVYILDMKGRVLIWRDYRGDVPASAAEKFFTKLIEGEVSGIASQGAYRFVNRCQYALTTETSIII